MVPETVKHVETTEARVRTILSEDCGLDDVVGSADLEDEYKLDSLDRAELYMRLEIEFGVDINDDDWDKLYTVNQIVAYLEKKRQP